MSAVALAKLHVRAVLREELVGHSAQLVPHVTERTATAGGQAHCESRPRGIVVRVSLRACHEGLRTPLAGGCNVRHTRVEPLDEGNVHRLDLGAVR